MYPKVHSPIKIREKRVTASLQIAVKLVTSQWSCHYHSSAFNAKQSFPSDIQPDMINYVFLQYIQSCSHELSHHASLCHAQHVMSSATLSCFSTLCHAPSALIHYVMIFFLQSSILSYTIIQCFSRLSQSCNVSFGHVHTIPQ